MKNPWAAKYVPIGKKLENLAASGVFPRAVSGISIELCISQPKADELLFKGVPCWPELENRWREQCALRWPTGKEFNFGFHDLFLDRWREGIRRSLSEEREYRAGLFLSDMRISADAILKEIPLFKLLSSDFYWSFFNERHASFSLEIFRGKSVLEIEGSPRKWSKSYLEEGCRRFSELVGSSFCGDFSGKKNIWWKCEFFDPSSAHAGMKLWNELFGSMIRLNDHGVLPHQRVVRSPAGLEIISMHEVRQVCLFNYPLLKSKNGELVVKI